MSAALHESPALPLVDEGGGICAEHFSLEHLEQHAPLLPANCRSFPSGGGREFLARVVESAVRYERPIARLPRR